MQGYPANYPYYSQQSLYTQQQPQQYPATGYPTTYNAFPSYGQPPASTPFIPPLSSFDAQPSQPQTQAKAKRYPKQTPNPNAQPLKSALKKQGAVTPGPVPAQNLPPESKTKRTRTISNAKEQPPDLYRSDLQDSSEPFQTIHIFLQFVGTSEVHLEYLTPQAQEEILTIFKHYPAGIEMEHRKNSLWRIRLRGSPWDVNSYHSDAAMKLIVNLLTLFSHRGFAFQTTTNIGSPSPRLVFITARMDSASVFFLAYFSKSGRRVTLVRPPPAVGSGLGPLLKQRFKDQLSSDMAVADTRVIELKPPVANRSQQLADPTFFMLQVIRGINELGFHLEASILMAPRLSIGPIGIGHRRELMVFKGR